MTKCISIVNIIKNVKFFGIKEVCTDAVGDMREKMINLGQEMI